MNVMTLYQGTVAGWNARLAEVRDDQWDAVTPCSEWTVRDLVNHVAGEDRWMVPLLRGRTIDDVGDTLDGDLLGTEPAAAARTAAEDAVAEVLARVPEGGKVHLSYGDETVEEYVMQVAADHLIHGWDLAAATGGDTSLDATLVAEVSRWFVDREELYRSGGAIGPRRSAADDPGVALLAAFGRDAGWTPEHATLARFSAAFGSGDVDGVMRLMTEDCVFESTSPAPDGVRLEGAAAVRATFEELFASTRDATFAAEESFVAGDRAVLRWRFSWSEADGSPGQVRGVDVLRLRDGLVAEKLSYVKG
ncbi:MAG: TIGR03086 family metal-binding protein [Nocardioidaceae bacterium]